MPTFSNDLSIRCSISQFWICGIKQVTIIEVGWRGRPVSVGHIIAVSCHCRLPIYIVLSRFLFYLCLCVCCSPLLSLSQTHSLSLTISFSYSFNRSLYYPSVPLFNIVLHPILFKSHEKDSSLML